MPVIPESSYKPPFLLRKNHLNTIYAGLFRTVKGVQYQRERITTPDDDFIDLDWSKKGNNKLLIVLHGLEGSADRPYVQGLIKWANANGWDGVGKNFRFCSGEPNKQKRVYHSGASDDLEVVVQHILKHYNYDTIALAGFSLGGNVVLKYVGEQGSNIHPTIKAAVGVSVPCDLYGCRTRFEKWDNKLYVRRFLDSLFEKIMLKRDAFPDAVDYDRLLKVQTIWEFDNIFTGPIHGFDGADDYYLKCRSINVMDQISIPTLLLNAKDDSFLSESCFPYNIAEQNQHFYLETPNHGGHVGFTTFGNNGYYWSEQRVVEFINQHVS